MGNCDAHWRSGKARLCLVATAARARAGELTGDSLSTDVSDCLQ